MSHAAVLLRAFAYLQATSIRNAVVHRLKRLRQPKYLVGAIVAIGYLYFFVFRHAWRERGGGFSAMPAWLQQPEALSTIVALAALVLLVLTVLAWVVPSSRAALDFSEAEVAFLFPAPLTRRMLVHYKLLRSQLGILFSALLIALVSRRTSMFGGHALLHAVAWWLLLSMMRLHVMGASFARDLLLERGVNTWRRRALVLGAVLLVLLASFAWTGFHFVAPTAADLDDGHALLRYASGVLATPPLAWVLAPFKWAAAPLFAFDARMLLRALPPALLLLLLHYVWVVRSDAAFEDASIDAARRKAARLADVRAGKSPFGRRPGKPRNAPFRLAAQGPAPVAFLWKGLIAMGSFFRLRTWLIACAAIVAGGLWLRGHPALKPALLALGSFAMMFAGWFLVLGPMVMQRGLRRTLDHFDVLKASPLAGRQIVMGELLAPMAVLSAAQWLLLVLGAMAFVDPARDGLFGPVNVVVGLVGLAALAPALCGLMLCVPFAGILLFPAWVGASSGRGGGVEVMGQRLIFFAGYLLVLAVAVVPAAVVGGIAFLAGRWLGDTAVGLALAALAGGVVLAFELRLAVAWLGQRVERFDLSRELPG